MLFNSYLFTLVFLPLTVIAFYFSRSEHRAMSVLIAASAVFYAYWSELFYLLILAGIVITFWISRHLLLSPDNPTRTRYLIVGIIVNLIPLIYFKYAFFVVSNIQQVFGWELEFHRTVLPLAISFYTFQKIVLLVQSYRREVPDVSFRSYWLFVTFFPHLIAGPITSARELLPQFAERKTYCFRSESLAIGLTIFIIGLSKKVLVADAFAPYATAVFQAADHGAPVSLTDAWSGALCFTFQLYFDFSGYSDMAIGLARMFNITMPINFFSPYKSTSISEFWRHWHMSLSWFLREYVYIPLGGNRQGMPRHLTNIFITMVVAGVWHGAGWTFVLFGTLHGALLILNVLWRRHGIGIGRVASWFLTFGGVVIGWIFFRAETVAGAAAMLKSMVGFNGFVLPKRLEPIIGLVFGNGITYASPTYATWSSAVLIIVGVLGVLMLPNTTQVFEPWRMSHMKEGPSPSRLQWRLSYGWALITSTLAILCLVRMQTYSEFLYFNF